MADFFATGAEQVAAAKVTSEGAIDRARQRVALGAFAAHTVAHVSDSCAAAAGGDATPLRLEGAFSQLLLRDAPETASGAFSLSCADALPHSLAFASCLHAGQRIGAPRSR